jgi:ubiquinone/menaquinone biosynthesis C-methylase UbiE
MRRVLRPGGRLLVLDFFRRDPAAAGASRGAPAAVQWWLDATVPRVGKLLGRDRDAYAYLTASMDRFLSPDEFAALLGELGFRDVFVERQTFGIAHLIGGVLE